MAFVHKSGRIDPPGTPPIALAWGRLHHFDDDDTLCAIAGGGNAAIKRSTHASARLVAEARSGAGVCVLCNGSVVTCSLPLARSEDLEANARTVPSLDVSAFFDVEAPILLERFVARPPRDEKCQRTTTWRREV